MELEKFRPLEAFLKARQAEIYPEPQNELNTAITRQMAEMVLSKYDFAPDARVLDVGCGNGLALEIFRDAGLNPTGIAFGEDLEVCSAKGLDVVEMDQSFLDFDDESFDLVWCRHCLEHSIFPFFTLAGFYRVLKPGGALYVEVPAPDTASHHETNPNHYSVHTWSCWRTLIDRTGFVDVESQNLAFKVVLGDDLYWAFMQRRPEDA